MYWSTEVASYVSFMISFYIFSGKRGSGPGSDPRPAALVMVIYGTSFRNLREQLPKLFEKLASRHSLSLRNGDCPYVRRGLRVCPRIRVSSRVWIGPRVRVRRGRRVENLRVLN